MHWWLLAHTQALEPHTESTGLSVCSCLNHKIACLIDIHVAIKQVKINTDHAVNEKMIFYFQINITMSTEFQKDMYNMSRCNMNMV